MDLNKLKEERISSNKKLADRIAEVCAKYDLRFIQLVDNLNLKGDFFYEEPSDTLKRLNEYVSRIERQK